MAQYRTEKDGNQVTIWDDTEGVGIRFTEGETQQGYTATAIIKRPDQVTTPRRIERITKAITEITLYAEKQYPAEFAELQ